MFQSLSGFFRPCNQKPRRCGRSPRRRFNPCRVFSGLATSHEIVSTSAGPRFQSLSGFFRPCNGDDRVRVIHQEVVSIPVGFFQALQRRTGCSGAATLSLFQSLSGFFRPCNAVDPQIHHGLPLFQSLSGFFRPCNVTRSHPAQLRGRCFNPCRVFSGLATHNSRGGSPRVLSFQSLSGFFRPCNWSCSRRCWSDRGVSIPVGFFQALQRPGLVHLRVGERQVSIPVGFFQALQQPTRSRLERTPNCFNPCRVFSGLATTPADVTSARRAYGFNPCRVFSGLATFSWRWCPQAVWQVSIPVGFFQALQRGSLLRQAAHVQFQSLSGFFRPCNRNGVIMFVGPDGFQSLSGFFRPCNLIRGIEFTSFCSVSIPVGFFQALQPTVISIHKQMQGLVSIPVGFFQALQRHPWVGYFSI